MMNRSRQSGFTLIEILVALVIGLFLAGGMIAMVQHNKTTFLNQNKLAQLQDNQRFAMSVMNDVIQAAGYFPDPTTNTAITVMPASAAYPGFATAGQPLFGPASNDQIQVQFALAQNDTTLLCDGTQNGLAAVTAYVNTLQVNASNQLTCTQTVATAKPGTPVVLVDNVTALTVRYGLNSAGATTTHDVTVYKLASQMTAADWMNVSAVQVTLSFVNPLYGQPGQTNPAQQTVSFSRTIGIMMRVGVTTG
jgi:type IV pilus assembly protein PilW